MLTLEEYVRLPETDFAQHDVAAYHLACAQGLPGSEKIDADRCFRILDEMRAKVESETERLLPMFRRKPRKYNNSEAYFRVLAMITVLQRDMGVKYNHAKIDPNTPLTTEDTFIHGVLYGNGGTCASMPVVYAAVGRRLGYPIKLVETQTETARHLFNRWDDPATGERFNIDATNKGLNCRPDDYYRSGIYGAASLHDRERLCGLLRSMTPRQELASFLMERGLTLLDHGQHREAVRSFTWAWAMCPDNEGMRVRLLTTMNAWYDRLTPLTPPCFPPVDFQWGPRRYPPSLPEEFEKNVLILEAMECMLTDPGMNETFWEPMRQWKKLDKVPVKVNVRPKLKGMNISLELVNG